MIICTAMINGRCCIVSEIGMQYLYTTKNTSKKEYMNNEKIGKKSWNHPWYYIVVLIKKRL